jgi:hypothetical protein
MTDIPLTEFQGTLKQLAIAECSEPLRALFVALFPRFFDTFTHNWSEESQRAYEKVPGIQLGQPKLARRFGGYFLPRSRYYTVCQDALGNDGGTLMNELRTYRDPVRTGMVEVIDTGLGSIGLISGGQVTRLDRSPALAALIHDPNRLRLHLEHVPSEVIPVPEGKEGALVRFPYTLSESRLSAVVDLRVPATRAWFFEQFSKQNDDWIWPEGMQQKGFTAPDPPKTFVTEYDWQEHRAPVPTSFVEMLPTLLNPRRGGGDQGWGGTTLMAIGEWLRNRHVDALIYPSARSDWHVIYENGQMSDFSGWCLVDYRHAADEEKAHYVVFDSSPWSWVALPEYITLRMGAEGSDRTGSLALSGVAKESSSDYVDQIACLRAAEANVGPPSTASTPRGAYAIGVYALRWLHMAMLRAEQEHIQDAFRTYRGLLVQLNKEHLARHLRLAHKRLVADGNLQPALHASIDIVTEVQETIGDRQEIRDVVTAAFDLELALLILTRFTLDGAKSVPEGLSAKGLNNLPLPDPLRHKANEFLRLLQAPGTSIESCAVAGAQLSSALTDHYAHLRN